MNNGVTVRFAAADTSGHTDPGISANAQGQKVTTATNTTGQNSTVTIDPSRNGNDDDYAFTVAHEGTHVADIADLARALPTDLTSPEAAFAINGGAVPILGVLNITKWETETRAYTTEALAAQALVPNQSLSIGGNPRHRHEIWNPGWAEADRATQRSSGMFGVLTEPRSHGGV